MVKQVEDWTSYKKSVLWDISSSFCQERGFKAWTSDTKLSISTCNYQYALAIARLLKKSLAVCKTTGRLDVLECGAGSAKFSRNFLLACKQLKILNRVRLLVSDYTKANLEEIKSLGVLREFNYKQEYDLLHLDITRLDQATTLDGRSFVFDKLYTVIANYVFECLPLTVLSLTEEGSTKELEVKVNEYQPMFSDRGIKHRSDTLILDHRLVDYRPNEEEQKYFGMFKDFYHKQKKFDTLIPFAYKACEAVQGLMRYLHKDGFLFFTNLMNTSIEPWFFVADILAHEQDQGFLLYAFARKFHSYSVSDNSTARSIITKNKKLKNQLSRLMNKVFVRFNMVNRFLCLYKAIEKFKYKEVADCFRFLLQKFTQLTNRSAFVYKLWSDYYLITGDDYKARLWLKKAQAIDFWNETKN